MKLVASQAQEDGIRANAGLTREFCPKTELTKWTDLSRSGGGEW